MFTQKTTVKDQLAEEAHLCGPYNSLDLGPQEDSGVMKPIDGGPGETALQGPWPPDLRVHRGSSSRRK